MSDQGTDVLSAPLLATSLIAPVVDEPVEVDYSPAPERPARAREAVEAQALCAPVEAMLITSGRAVTASRLAEALGLTNLDATPEAGPLANNAFVPSEAPASVASGKRLRRAKAADPLALIARAVELLNQQYFEGGRAFRIELIAGGYRVLTLGEHAGVLTRFHNAQGEGRLSKAGVETLAIIAYKQPMTRARLEAIRGVACGEVLRSLLERRLINIAGRAEELGRPMLYGTTKHFLEAFGLASLGDLPSPSDFATLRRTEPATDAKRANAHLNPDAAAEPTGGHPARIPDAPA